MHLRCSASLVVISLSLAQAAAQAPGACRFLRSSSGPSGKVSGAKFLLDETRHKFVYPADKAAIVFFEWQGKPGTQVLSGIWKHPGGKGKVLSPDIRLDTAVPEFGAYWTLNLSENLPGGVWELEVRVNGQPCGSHFFELVIPAKPEPAPPPAAEPPATAAVRPAKSVDELYRSISSLVWIHKRDTAGRRLDTSSGFVVAPGRILTAFQSVDSAVSLEVEFHDQKKVLVNELLAWNRYQDWAVLAADTGQRQPLAFGSPDELPVGDRAVIFNVESGMARAIGGVDIAGRSQDPEFGPRILLSPPPTAESAGGPVLNVFGEVVALLGGSLAPGSRSRGTTVVSAGLWLRMSKTNLALPVTAIKLPAADATPVGFSTLLERGILVPPLGFSENLIFGGTTNFIPKYDRGIPSLNTVAEFSRSEAGVIIYTVWQKKDKNADRLVAYHVYDLQNRERVKSPAKKVGWTPSVPVLSSVRFAPAALGPGIYRVDVLLGEQPVWRTYFRILE